MCSATGLPHVAHCDARRALRRKKQQIAKANGGLFFANPPYLLTTSATPRRSTRDTRHGWRDIERLVANRGPLIRCERQSARPEAAQACSARLQTARTQDSRAPSMDGMVIRLGKGVQIMAGFKICARCGAGVSDAATSCLRCSGVIFRDAGSDPLPDEITIDRSAQIPEDTKRRKTGGIVALLQLVAILAIPGALILAVGIHDEAASIIVFGESLAGAMFIWGFAVIIQTLRDIEYNTRTNRIDPAKQ
jgi:hypothetical protein